MKTSIPFLIPLVLALAVVCVRGVAQPPAATPITVPFEFHRHSIVVQVMVQGQGPFTMLLDTGVDPSAVDLAVARKLGLKLSSEGGHATGGGSEATTVRETEMPTVALGGLVAEHVVALAADLTKTGQALGRPLHGVLGYSFLEHRVVQIDYPRRVVRFYARSPFSAGDKSANGPHRTTLPFRYQDDILLDGVTINGQRLIANFDTGSSGRFQLAPAAVARLGLESVVNQGAVTKSVGINGQTVNHEGQVDRITVGSIVLDHPGVVFYPKAGGYDEVAWGVRIGNGFLQDYVATIDYQNSTITLEKP